MKRTLYISDLDGTLLNSRVEISSYSADVINRLVREQGLIFSYATARSPVTAFPVTKNLSTNKRKNLIDLTNSKGNLIILKDF